MLSTVEHRANVLIGRFLDYVCNHEPVQATRLGLSARDGDLPDLAPSELARRSRDLAVLAAEVRATLADLAVDANGSGTSVVPRHGHDRNGRDRNRRDRNRVHPPGLGQTDVDREPRDDLRLLDQELTYRRFLLDDRPRYVLDPLAALETVAAGIHELLRFDDGDGEDRCQRLDAAVQRARRVPVLLEQAGGLLASSAAPNLEVALQRLPGLIALVRDELPRRAEQLGVDVSPARDAGEVAAEGLEAYGALIDELSDEPAADWRLGAEPYALTLAAGLGAGMDAGDIEDRARSWLGHVGAELAELSTAGWARRFHDEPVPADHRERVRRSLAWVAADSVDDEALLDEARLALHETHRFTQDAGITDLPPMERLTVRAVPAHLRGVAVAFVVPPPPLCPQRRFTLYLSAASPSMASEGRGAVAGHSRVQLRSFAIHEAYPGHVVQLEHAQASPRLARRLFTRAVFAEGWAVHIEREVLAAGFGRDGTSQVAEDDYRLIQRLNEVRIAVNALVDVGLHAGTLDDDAALGLLTRTGLQTRAEARGMLVRAKVSPGDLTTYFVGGEELSDLQRVTRQREGNDFDQHRFHQRLLSHGTPTVAMIAEALREDAPVYRPLAIRV